MSGESGPVPHFLNEVQKKGLPVDSAAPALCASQLYFHNLSAVFSLSATKFMLPSYTWNSLFILSCHLDYMHV